MKLYVSPSRLRKNGTLRTAENSLKKYYLGLLTSYPKDESSCLSAGWPNLSNLPSATLIFSLKVMQEQIDRAAHADILPSLNSF